MILAILVLLIAIPLIMPILMAMPILAGVVLGIIGLGDFLMVGMILLMLGITSIGLMPGTMQSAAQISTPD